MAGLKTFWILIYSLLLLAACVPQTKQTECQGNEAFNAALRTCVPVVGGPSSFINIGTPSPAFTQTRHKADTTTLQFSISVSNPYNQTYTVAWERVFNGAPTAMCSNSLTCSFSAYLLGTTYGEVGTHILTAKILDGNGSVVDTHSFELKINELPKPIINTASLLPTQYAFTVTPGIASTEFKFNIKNNQATIAQSHYYRTEWTIEKNGTILYTENDTFTNFSPSGTNLAYLGTSPTPYFNPSTLGVGSYIVRAVVKNDVPGEVVDEHQWNVTVSHPALKKINSRDIYTGSNNPNGVSAVSIAYNGIAYTSALTYNFIPQSIGGTTFTLQGNYCVSVENGEGTYVGDNLGVKVNFLIDGGPQIYSGTTTALNSKICLSDAAATTLNNMLFSNTTTTGEQNHTLVARVFDLATNQEYTTSDMPGLGNYPVTWNFLVKPANAAPTVTFTNLALNGISCATAIGNAKTCSVTQDTPFSVGAYVTDDFYNTASNSVSQQNKFFYTMTLMRNGTPLSTCTKTINDVNNTGGPTGFGGANDDHLGPDYLCGFTVPSYDANGPVNPNAYTYTVVVSFSDVGSPIPGTSSMTGNTITYNLNVSEINSAPTISAQGLLLLGSHVANASTTPSATILDPNDTNSYITEGELLKFKINVNDAERDNHQIVIKKCSESTCVATGGTSSLLTSTFVTKTNNILSTSSSLTYTLLEDFIPISVASGTSYPVGFKVEVTDCPSILTNAVEAIACNTFQSPATMTATPRLSATTEIFKVNVRNKNPAPIFGGTPNPLLSYSMTAMVGFPITIHPGTATDASVIPSEANVQYQWYIDPDGGNNSYSKIVGATKQNLRWTPSNGIPTDTIVNLAICVTDGTNMNPLPVDPGALSGTSTAPTGSNCLKPWNVKVKRNAVPVNYFGSPGNVGDDLAVWQDTTNGGADKKVIYSAYTDPNGKIFVEKTVFDSNGNIFNNDISGFRSVVFDAIKGGGQIPSSVKDLSLAGTSTHLYIVYQAAHTSNPSAPQIRVRRIDKSYGAGIGSKGGTYPHAGKFGFTYDGPLANSLWPVYSDSSGITISQSSLGSPILVDFVSSLSETNVSSVTNTLTTNTVPMTVDDTPSATQLCSGSTSGCSLQGNAGKFMDFINNLSNDRLLQGVTADASGGQVFLTGSLSGSEYLDTNTNVSSFVTGKLGKIMITGGKWYIPFVDLTTGSSLSHIRVLVGDAGSANTLNSSTPVASNISYSTIGAVNYFTNELNPSGNITIASVNTSNIAQLHVFDVSGNPVPTPGIASSQLFGGAPVLPTSLRLGVPSSGTTYYFVAAKVLASIPSTYQWNISRCTAGFDCSQFDNTDDLSLSNVTGNIFGVSSVVDLSIEPYPTYPGEARILVSSYFGHAEPHLYSVRYRFDNKISCGLCVKLDLFTNPTSEKLSPTAKIATARIDQNMIIGTGGSTLLSPNENQRDLLFAIYPVKSGTGFFTPQLGIFNANNDLIDSTSSDTTGNLGHRPAFFSDL
jgi:hypothetical protein